ncbi:MAG: type II toxin-antitoxin system HicA family toxin [Wenzhouxiangellaceae bacterium]
MDSYTPLVKKRLKKFGCKFLRQGTGDHEIWQNPKNNKQTTVDNTIKSRHTANRIFQQLGFDKQF